MLMICEKYYIKIIFYQTFLLNLFEILLLYMHYTMILKSI